MQKFPDTSLVVRKKDDGYHSILLNGEEIAHAIKKDSLHAVYPTRYFGKTEVTLTLVVDDFHADDREPEKHGEAEVAHDHEAVVCPACEAAAKAPGSKRVNIDITSSTLSQVDEHAWRETIRRAGQ